MSYVNSQDRAPPAFAEATAKKPCRVGNLPKARRSFSEAGLPTILIRPDIFDIAWQIGPAAPIRLVPARLDISLEAGVGPITRGGAMAVLDGVDMDIINVHVVIAGISDSVFPESLLPDAPTPLAAL
jgi:hypothetical protein